MREGLVESMEKSRSARQSQEVVDISSAAGTAVLPDFQPAVVLKTALYCIEISNLAQQDTIRSTLAVLQQLCQATSPEFPESTWSVATQICAWESQD